jgi:hypothetical protein
VTVVFLEEALDLEEVVEWGLALRVVFLIRAAVGVKRFVCSAVIDEEGYYVEAKYRRKRGRKEETRSAMAQFAGTYDIQVASFLRAISRNFLMSWICLG